MAWEGTVHVLTSSRTTSFLVQPMPAETSRSFVKPILFCNGDIVLGPRVRYETLSITAFFIGVLHRNTELTKTPREPFLSAYNSYLPHQTQFARPPAGTCSEFHRCILVTTSGNSRYFGRKRLFGFLFLAIFVYNVRRILATAARQSRDVDFPCEVKTESTSKYTLATADEPPGGCTRSLPKAAPAESQRSC